MFLHAEMVSPQSAKQEEARRSGPLCRSDVEPVDQPTVTSIAFGFAFSDLGS
jgi:hypothetical protein